MELSESVDSINRQLREQFGIDSSTSNPIFRVVWSEDQYEKRMSGYTPEGIELLVPQVQLLPKYKQWIKEKYVLERLVVVPEINVEELAGLKVSYEPVWVFADKNDNYLPPKFEVAKFVIDCLYAAMGKSSLAKYKDEDATPETREMRISKLQEDMFGNETDVGDALAYKEGVSLSGPVFGDK